MDISHICDTQMKLFSEEHISSMTEIGYAAKSHKVPLSKSLVLKSCKFIRSAWLMEDETFYGRLRHKFVRHKYNLD